MPSYKFESVEGFTPDQIEELEVGYPHYKASPILVQPEILFSNWLGEFSKFGTEESHRRYFCTHPRITDDEAYLEICFRRLARLINNQTLNRIVCQYSEEIMGTTYFMININKD
jgi:hypothetical protein